MYNINILKYAHLNNKDAVTMPKFFSLLCFAIVFFSPFFLIIRILRYNRLESYLTLFWYIMCLKVKCVANRSSTFFLDASYYNLHFGSNVFRIPLLLYLGSSLRYLYISVMAQLKMFRNKQNPNT